MKAHATTESPASYFLGVLHTLSEEGKLDLIAHLSQSIKSARANEGKSLLSLFGAYKGDETADEIVNAIYTSRVSDRHI